MTTTQAKLARIRAACQRVLELDAAATPASKWFDCRDGWVTSICCCTTDNKLNDAALIALSRTLTPAFARAVLAALDGLDEIETEAANHADGTFDAPTGDRACNAISGTAQATIDAMLGAFPDDV